MEDLKSLLLYSIKSDIIEKEDMPNGERRIRLKLNNNSVFSMTQTQDTSGWQNAHYHINATETYIMQKGKIKIVKIENGKIKTYNLKSGDIFKISPKIEHNVFVEKNTTFYVFKKSNQSLEGDWFKAINF